MHDTVTVGKPRRLGAFVVCLALVGGFFGALSTKSAQAQTVRIEAVNPLFGDPTRQSGEEATPIAGFRVSLAGLNATATTYTVTVQTINGDRPNPRFNAIGDNFPPPPKAAFPPTTGLNDLPPYFYPNDYFLKTQTFTFTNVATASAEFNVSIIDEKDYEAILAGESVTDYQFFYARIIGVSVASTGTGGGGPSPTITNNQVRHFIIDNDARPDIAVAPVRFDAFNNPSGGDVNAFVEGNPPPATTTKGVTVFLSARNEVEDINFNYSFSSGTSSTPATVGTDFDNTAGQAVFLRGQTIATDPLAPASPTPIRLDVRADTNDEPDEDVLVTLSGATTARVATVTGNVLILDDDAPSATISDVSIIEPDNGQTAQAVFRITLSSSSAQDVTIRYTVNPISAPPDNDPAEETAVTNRVDDYEDESNNPTTNPNNGTVDRTINAGTTTLDISVPILGDLVDEANETFEVLLFSGANTRGVRFLNTAGTTDNQGIGTILDNDRPTFRLGTPLSVTEPTTGQTTLNFPVTLDQPSERLLTIQASTQDNTAVSGGTAALGTDDYDSNSQTLTFQPGVAGDPTQPAVQNRFFQVDINSDTVDEIDESFFVNLTNPNVADALIAVGQTTGTIIDNDGPQITIVNPTPIPEGDSGTKELVFTVTLSAPSPQQITVNYSTQDGAGATGAKSGGVNPDYQAETGTLVFLPNTTTPQTPLSISIIGNTTKENSASETFLVIFSGATNSDPSQTFPLQATGTITEDDPIPTVTVDDSQAVEGVGVVFTIRLTNNGDNTKPITSENSITVNFSTSPGSATDNIDYTRTQGSVTFSPAASGFAAEFEKQVTVPTIADTIDEANETFNLDLSLAPGSTTFATFGATSNTDTQAIGTIIDDEARSISISSPAAITEGDSGTSNLAFTVSVSGAAPNAQAITVNYTINEGSATEPEDFQGPLSGTVTIPAGASSATINVPIVGDTINESSPQTFTVTITTPNAMVATVTNGTATGSILDNDSASISFGANSGDIQVTEGSSGVTNAAFVVTLSAPSDRAVRVDYTVSATGTNAATAGSDFQGTTGSITFQPGDTSETINVPIVGDTTDEENETFTVTLTNPGLNGISISDGTATGTIMDDDGAPSLSVSNVQVIEGDGGAIDATFTVTLAPASQRTVTVNFTTSNGSATAPDDFQSTSGVLTFAPGETSKTIAVSVQGDEIDEDDDTFFVELTGATNAVIGDGQGVGTIIDNDGPNPDLSIANVTLTEGDSGNVNATFTVRLSAASLKTVTVDFTTVAGTATAGTDFTATSGRLTFAPGELSKTITVEVKGDTLDEANETFLVRLSNAVNAQFANGQTDATGTITDDDVATLTLTLSANTVAEGGTVTGTVSRNTATNEALVVTLSSSDASEATVPTQVTIPAGNTSVGFTITGETEEAVDGSQTVTISASANGFVAASAQLTVTDVIPARLTLTISPSLLREGGSPTAATATISRNVAFDSDLVVTLSNSNPNRVTVPGSVTISAGSSSATFTIRAIDDEIASGSQAVAITAQANGFAPDTAGVTVVDNDEAGITITPRSVLRTTEEGGTATFSIKLNSRPLSDVTIDLQLDPRRRRTEVRLPLTSITIKPDQFAFERTVTVIGVNDREVDGDQTVIISTRPAQSTDPAYRGINPPDVTVVNEDNEVPDFNVSPLTLRTTEAISGRSQATFTISLKASPVPGTSVFIGLTSGDPSEGKVSPQSIGFNSKNFNVPQTVRITAVDDRVADNDVTYRIITSPAKAPGTPYDGLNPPDVTVTNEDNDDNTVPRVVITSPTANASVRSIITFTGTATDPGPATIARVFGVLFRTLPNGRREFFSANGVPSSSEQRLTVSGIERFRILLSLPPGRTLPSGRYTLVVTAIDTAGNQGTGSVTFTLNNQPPVIAITSPRTGGIVRDASTISGTVRPAEGLGTIASVSVLIKRGTTIVKRLAATVTGDRFTSDPVGTLADGNYTAEATARDSAGNTATATTSFQLDRTAPTGVTITSPTNGATVDNIRLITGTAGDTGSGLSRVELIIRRRSDDTYFNGSAFVPRPTGRDGVPGAEPTVSATLSGNTFSYTLPSGLPADPDPLNAAYTITAIAVDTAGNKTSSSQVTVRLSANGNTGGGTGGGTDTPGTSNVRLSSVSVKASDASIVLAFNGNLNGDVARDASLYTVTVNGQAVTIESVSFRAVDGVVVITLDDGAISIGDAVSVRFTNLRDAAGLTVAGQATVTTR